MRTDRIFLPGILFFCLLLSACSTAHTGSADFAIGRAKVAEAPDLQVRQIIKKGHLSIEVRSIESTTKSLKQIVTEQNGYIDSTNSGEEGKITFSTRIPSKQFEIAIDQISDLGDLTSKSIRTDDVTEELVDVEAKINNLEALRNRLRELLVKAHKVKEIIDVEKELTRVQTELDIIQGRKKSLSSQVAMSSLQVNVTQETIYGPLGYVANGLLWVVEKLFVIR